jgi:hypothetical protein
MLEVIVVKYSYRIKKEATWSENNNAQKASISLNYQWSRMILNLSSASIHIISLPGSIDISGSIGKIIWL